MRTGATAGNLLPDPDRRDAIPMPKFCSLLPLLLLCFVSLVALPAQSDLDAHLDAVNEFTKQFKKFKDEPLQVEAVRTLQGNECVPAAKELLALLTHKSAAVQQAALDVLATYQQPSTFQAWIDELPELKDQEQIAILIKVLGRSHQKNAVPAIEAAGADAHATPVIKYEAARALQAIGDPGQKALLGTLLTDSDFVVRMAAADAVGALKVQEHAAAVIPLLQDPEWQVQTAAIEAAARLRPQPAVQPMIDLMRKTGRLRTECADALFRITGLDFGVDPDRWQEQWTTLMGIQGWRIPTDEEMKQKAESRKKYDAFYGKKGESNSFIDIQTTSTNVLFIIDISGSMEDLVVEVDKFREYRDRKRFTIVQTELLNTLDTLTADTNVDIVAFATDLTVWKKRLVPANIVNREAAKSFVKGLKPIGGSEAQDLAASGLTGSANLEGGKTNTLKALLYAFGIDPEKPPKASVTGFDKKALKRPLDTIYFLSDGRPSIGKLIDTNEILAEIKKQNELFRMVIHTIAIGDFEKSFLEQLAKQNGGDFVDMGR